MSSDVQLQTAAVNQLDLARLFLLDMYETAVMLARTGHARTRTRINITAKLLIVQ